jgi:protein-L-isoaspartate(D-aspartate) O-methyltransferase
VACVKEDGHYILANAAAALGVEDDRVLQAMHDVDRSVFVPSARRAQAGLDRPIPIGHAQVTTQPSLVAVVLQGLGLTGGETVLEVGTGRGYQTALLAKLTHWVWSMERWPDLAEAARAGLHAAGISNVTVVVGDGTKGLPAAAPFDSVVVTAAFPSVPPPLVEQLTEGGRLVQPIGRGGNEEVTLFVKRGRLLGRRRVLIGARFVPLIGAHAFPP